jgi:hypothetical protein
MRGTINLSIVVPAPQTVRLSFILVDFADLRSEAVETGAPVARAREGTRFLGAGSCEADQSDEAKLEGFRRSYRQHSPARKRFTASGEEGNLMSLAGSLEAVK